MSYTDNNKETLLNGAFQIQKSKINHVFTFYPNSEIML